MIGNCIGILLERNCTGWLHASLGRKGYVFFGAPKLIMCIGFVLKCLCFNSNL